MPRLIHFNFEPSRIADIHTSFDHEGCQSVRSVFRISWMATRNWGRAPHHSQGSVQLDFGHQLRSTPTGLARSSPRQAFDPTITSSQKNFSAEAKARLADYATRYGKASINLKRTLDEDVEFSWGSVKNPDSCPGPNHAYQTRITLARRIMPT